MQQKIVARSMTYMEGRIVNMATKKAAKKAAKKTSKKK